MSVAEDEAEEVYPTRHWNWTHVKELFNCDTDDLQEAYLCGRLAPPADVEVEAVAKRLLWRDMSPVYGASEDGLWNRSEQRMQDMYRKGAREILKIARKAVSE